MELSAKGAMETTPSPVRVLCVEDNQLVADAISRKLEGDSRFQWLGWVGTAEALYETVSRTPPDVVCMDLDIPGQDTFAMVRGLGERCPSARVLMLSGHVRQDLIDNAVSAGAWGYLSKGEESRVIVDGLRRVAEGEFVLGTIAREGFHGPLPTDPPAPDREPAGEPPRSGWNAIHVLRRVLNRFSSPS